MIVIKAISRVTAESLDPVVEQVKEIKARSLERLGVIGYDFFQQDEEHVVALEVFEDSDVLIAHVDGGGFDELFKLIEVERIELMGPISAEVRSRFEALANVAIYPSITETRDA
jgi:quinol monooxygenase YgiN